MRNKWSKILLKFFAELITVLIIGTVIMYFFSNNSQRFLEYLFPNLVYSGLLGMVLWKGNELGYVYIHRKKVWEKKITLKFLLGVLYVLIFSTIALILVELIWTLVWEGRGMTDYEFPSMRYLILILGICFIISFIVSIIQFIAEKKENLIKEEQLKAKILKLEYEALKNQLSPHFLFNSLNALTSLVGDNEDAVKFIKNLSDFYRYVLEQKDKEVVELITELNLINIFYYVLKIRFGNDLKLTTEIKDFNKNIIPLSLQIVIENAVKLTPPSKEKPLNINIYQSEGYLIVEYNKSKHSMKEFESANSLDRIKKRYSHLTDKSFEIINRENKYIAKLPLLEVAYESSCS